MDQTIVNDVYAYLADEKLNVDLIFDGNDDRGILINVRLREWKGGTNAGRMILAGGRTVDEALLWAVRASLAKRWLPINWARRAREVGVVKTPEVTEVTRDARSKAVLHSALFSEEEQYNAIQEDKNGLHVVSQERNKNGEHKGIS